MNGGLALMQPRHAQNQKGHKQGGQHVDSKKNDNSIINHMSSLPLITNQNKMSILAVRFHAYSHENKNRKEDM